MSFNFMAAVTICSDFGAKKNKKSDTVSTVSPSISHEVMGPLRGTLASSLRSPAEGEGNEGFPPHPEKDLESPSSTRLEALVPSRDSRVHWKQDPGLEVDNGN